jgi:hypothetical protein
LRSIELSIRIAESSKVTLTENSFCRFGSPVTGSSEERNFRAFVA